jgi:hypothetical protein
MTLGGGGYQYQIVIIYPKSRSLPLYDDIILKFILPKTIKLRLKSYECFGLCQRYIPNIPRMRTQLEPRNHHRICEDKAGTADKCDGGP